MPSRLLIICTSLHDKAWAVPTALHAASVVSRDTAARGIASMVPRSCTQISPSWGNYVPERNLALELPFPYAFLVRRWWLLYPVGSLLVWSYPSALFFELTFNLSYYAVNPACDSVGIPLIYAEAASRKFLPIVNCVTLLSTWHLICGMGPVRFRNRAYVRLAIAAVVFATLVLPLILQFALNFGSILPHTVTGDCSGRADPVTREVSWTPSFIYMIWLSAWVLFASTLAVAIVCEKTNQPGAGHGSA